MASALYELVVASQIQYIVSPLPPSTLRPGVLVWREETMACSRCAPSPPFPAARRSSPRASRQLLHASWGRRSARGQIHGRQHIRRAKSSSAASLLPVDRGSGPAAPVFPINGGNNAAYLDAATLMITARKLLGMYEGVAIFSVVSGDSIECSGSVHRCLASTAACCYLTLNICSTYSDGLSR